MAKIYLYQDENGEILESKRKLTEKEEKEYKVKFIGEIEE
jgi:hypothetical protein